MNPSDIWSSETRFIEFDVQNGKLGSFLIEAGFSQFLAVSQKRDLVQSIAAADPLLKCHLVYSSEPNVLQKNNADVLILSGNTFRSLWKYRTLRHAQDVVWCPSLRLSTLFLVVGLLVHLLFRRYVWKATLRYPGPNSKQQWMIVLGVRRRKKDHTARYYIPHQQGVSGFLHSLSDRKVGHVVLRWFELLPHLPAGEDLDLLVADDQFEWVRQQLNEGPGIVPCDLYTVSGLPGSDYQKMPYFPPYLADSLLAKACSHSSGCLIPSPRHYFLSLAYHAIYHKGEQSGLPYRQGQAGVVSDPEHDYTTILQKMALCLGEPIKITLNDLDVYLATQGWRPPRDMLVRLATRNQWIADRVRQWQETPDDPGLIVFVLREKCLYHSSVEQMVTQIERAGFSTVKTKVLTAQQSQYAAQRIRGGNWSRGPWTISAGLPAAAIVAYDLEPKTPSAKQRAKFPHVTNERILLKEKIRREYNHLLAKEQRCNPLHSSDNGREALHYIRVLMPESASEIATRIVEIRRNYVTTQPVLERLTRNGRRAKVERIEWFGKPAVRKSFKPHGQRFCRREAKAMRQLSHTINAIPPLLFSEDHAVVYPYYEDILRRHWSEGRLLPLEVAQQVIEALRKIYEAGFALIDAHVDNLLVDRQQGLKLVDLEFLYQYHQQPATFEKSYDMAGIPIDFDGDVPEGGGKNYTLNWKPLIGLSLESLLCDPTWLKHLKRVGYRIVHQPRLIRQRIRYWRRTLSIVFHHSAHSGAPAPQVEAIESPLGEELKRLHTTGEQAAA